MDSMPDGDYHRSGESGAIGSDAFQETDIYGITLPIVKHPYVAIECQRSSENRR
jgi:acetolactate synthase-1/2/3 large subunit